MMLNSNKLLPDSGKNPASFERGYLLFPRQKGTNTAILLHGGILPYNNSIPPVFRTKREGFTSRTSLKAASPEPLSGEKMANRQQNNGKTARNNTRERSATSVYLDSTRSGVSIPLTRLSMLVSGWLLAGDIKAFSRNTLERYRSRLQHFSEWCGEKNITEVGKMEVMMYLAYFRNERNAKPGHLKTIFATLHSFFSWCVQEQYISESPMARLEMPIDRSDKPHPYTEEDIAALLIVTTRTPQPRRDEAIFRVALDTGMRSSELCSLLIGDVNLDSSEIRIREGKGGKSRTVPICPETRKAIWLYLSHDRPSIEPDEPLFLSVGGRTARGALTRNGIYRMFARWAKAAGINRERVGAHTVRHTFGSEYIANDGDPFSLKLIMGHESLNTTMRYVDIGSENLKKKHAQFSPAAGLKVTRATTAGKMTPANTVKKVKRGRPLGSKNKPKDEGDTA